jgi:hypothetical protein
VGVLVKARTQAAVAALFLAAGLLRAAPSLSWPMVYDDLHLIRGYTAAELAGAWSGHWDPDGVETPGFRPLSLLFNHVRGSLLGENVAAHRVLVLVLLAACFALLVPVAGRFGAGPGTVLLAGIVFLAARHGTYHYVWITDGNHALQGLAFAGGALLLLQGLADRRRGRLAASLACLAAGLLVREDTLAVLPVIVLLGFLEARRLEDASARRFLVAYAAAAVVLAAALLAYRAWAVPHAQPPDTDVRSFLVAVVKVLNPVGPGWWDPVSRALSLGGWLVLAALLAALGVGADKVEGRRPLLWLACAVLACTPALTLQRDDLLFFPGTFVGLFYAHATAVLARRPGPVRTVAATGVAALVAASTYVGIVFAENFHPDSTRALWWNMQVLHGEFSAGATIPPARRQAALERLHRAGIREGQQPRQRIRDLSAEARAAGRRRPSPDGAVFLPWLPEQF